MKPTKFIENLFVVFVTLLAIFLFICLLVAGCVSPVTPVQPTPTVSIKSMVRGPWPPPHTNRIDTNFVFRPFTNITLEWNCYLPPPPNSWWATTYVTGIVSAPTPTGPWTEETNLPYAGTNRVTLPVNGPVRYYRAFNR
jgi:hypothetical protein